MMFCGFVVMTLVTNPILPGFHPDPCLCRAGDEYYLATSTFEWWPGVRIHRSRDLVNWEHAAYALTRRSQLDMRGNAPSGGVWAPALSYADGRFWLIYSDVKGFNGAFKDVTNYLVTAERVEGPWSDPVELNRSGFDPSLFHDDDGRKWLLNQLWDPRPGRHPFAGIVLQEYDPVAARLVGEPVNIFRGSPLRVTEGPHLYKRDGWYWLVTAEGGTGREHAVTVARSRTLTGPYEVHPDNPILTAVDRPELTLQKAGHGSFVQGPAGDWYLAHLCARPQGPQGRCILGRETALQALDWPVGDWPRLRGGGRAPAETVELRGTDGVVARPYRPRFRDEFEAPELHPEWNTLREPSETTWLSLTERPGWLRLRGRQSLQCNFEQSLVGVRLTHHECVARTRLDFQPRGWWQTAGLAWFYCSTQHIYLEVGGDDAGGRVLRVRVTDLGREAGADPAAEIALPPSGPLRLEARMREGELRFAWATDEGAWQAVPGVFDATLISDERMRDGHAWGFTGGYAVLCAQNSGADETVADFDWFEIEA
jgi:xylan 1,4-beta-xylosidase